MTVSTKLFADQMMNRFSQLNEAIELRQTKISTGRAISEAAEAPIAAVNLSAREEQLVQLEGFARNVQTAEARLSLADTTLQEADNIMVRLREQSIKSVNGTISASDLAAIRVEASQLREALLSLANTRTSDGQALFGGYATEITPFQISPEGRVAYHGDGGEHTLAASESMRLPTSVNGGEVFMQVQTDMGRQSIFDIVDSFEAALTTAGRVNDSISASAPEQLVLRVNGDRTPRDWSFTLAGPNSPALGQDDAPIGVRITASQVVDGNHTTLARAINAHSQQTGVTASEEDGRLVLTAASGQIELSDLAIEGVTQAEREPQFTLTEEGSGKTIVPSAQTLNAQLESITAAGIDIALSRTKIGARLGRAEMQGEALNTRTVAMERDVGELAAVDIEQMITELQSLLLTQTASRQAYSQISQTSLFDFLQ